MVVASQPLQCFQIKQLKKQYKDEVDKLQKSGVEIESGNDDIFVSFKCFLNSMP